jgi:hypothetical protein
MGIYLGPSLYHARNVGLILSLTTGLVSPSYNTKYDDNFMTVTDAFGNYVPRSPWQVKCGFRVDPMIPNLCIPPDKSTPSTHDVPNSSTDDQKIQVSEGDPSDRPSPPNTTQSDQISSFQPSYSSDLSTSPITTSPISEGENLVTSMDTSINHGSGTQINTVTGQRQLTFTRSGRISRPPKRFDDQYV